ncbi:hypothetical protein ASPCADRAFT_211759 [Aspergillus carbonarius ITEM 5010]|uniref:Uncharacterized protein n=1 Tax=Aspergillus carbonarius (strain ITEM 5010) TaxID=602072 RepID=A0A1R3R8K0_ASPC5|nr:hypothetical protein ASPCADRAFT_211759 [Aspergillus carbonarius ITEM 5010]
MEPPSDPRQCLILPPSQLQLNVDSLSRNVLDSTRFLASHPNPSFHSCGSLLRPRTRAASATLCHSCLTA